jgi:hypothetical protein
MAIGLLVGFGFAGITSALANAAVDPRRALLRDAGLNGL